MDAHISVLYLVRQVISLFNQKQIKTMIVLAKQPITKEQLMSQNLSEFPLPPLGSSPLEKTPMNLLRESGLTLPHFIVAETQLLIDSPKVRKLQRVQNLLIGYMREKKKDQVLTTGSFASAFLEMNREIWNYLNQEGNGTALMPRACYNPEQVDFFCFSLDTSDLVLNSLMNLKAALGHVIALNHVSLQRSLMMLDKEGADASLKGKQTLLQKATAELSKNDTLQFVEQLTDSKIIELAEEIEYVARILQLQEGRNNKQTLALMILSLPSYFQNQEDRGQFTRTHSQYLWEELGKDWNNTLSLPNFKNMSIIKLLMNSPGFKKIRSQKKLQKKDLFYRVSERQNNSVFSVILELASKVWFRLETLTMFQIRLTEREKHRTKWSIQEDLKHNIGNIGLLRKVVRHAAFWEHDNDLEAKREQLLRDLVSAERIVAKKLQKEMILLKEGL